MGQPIQIPGSCGYLGTLLNVHACRYERISILTIQPQQLAPPLAAIYSTRHLMSCSVAPFLIILLRHWISMAGLLTLMLQCHLCAQMINALLPVCH